MINAKSFYKLVKDYPVKSVDGALCFEISGDLPHSDLEVATKAFGFSPRGSIIRDNVLTLKSDAISWEDSQKKYFVSYDELLRDFLNKGKVPLRSLVYDAQDKKVHLLTDESPLNKKLIIVDLFIKLLAKLSDQSAPESGARAGYTRNVFFIKSDATANKYEVNTKLTWAQLSSALPKKLKHLENLISIIQQLDSCIKLGDIQDAERKNCMRSALDSLMSKAPNYSSMFAHLIAQIEDLKVLYTDHHDMFLNEFSVNKVIQEITAKDLEYVTKINEFTSSAQTKALAIPGAMVAIAAVLKVNSGLSAFGVFFGLVLTTIIIDRCLSIYKKCFNHIDVHIENMFSQYDNLSTESKVRQKAIDTQNNLIKLNRNAIFGLEFIRMVIWATVLFSAAYLSSQYYIPLLKL